MSYAAELTAIESEFATNWPHTEVAYQNVNFNPEALDEWVRISALPASANQISMGSNPYFRYRGLVAVQIFTKPGMGSLRSSQLADYVTAVFRSKNIGGIQFGVPAATRIGTVNGWYQVNVNCPYYREEL
jgi:hypothetical protein